MSELEPESAADFAAFLEGEGVMDWLSDTPPGEEVAETPALPDDTGTVERPRDEQGRFMSTKADEPEDSAEEPIPADAGTEPEAESTPEEPVEAQADEGEGDFVLEIDDDLQAVLDKYDGDLGKALGALKDSQSMIGRQANEVGELRQQLSQLEQAIQQGFAQQQAVPPPQMWGPYRNDIDENPQGLVVEAMERGDAQTMDMALRAWGEEDPFGASTFLFALQQQAAQAAPAAPVAQQPVEPTTPQGPSLEAAMADVVSRHPDVEKYLPQVQQVAEEFPTLRDSMRAGSPTAQAQAFEELLKIAKTRSSQGDTSAAMRRVILRTQEEVRKEKSDAAVVSAQNQTAATRESAVDEFYRAFGEAADRYDGADWITRSND